jgi:hypothetical protein
MARPAWPPARGSTSAAPSRGCATSRARARSTWSSSTPKTGYPAYLAWAEDHLRQGGLLLADNAFGFGHVHEARPSAEDPAAMAALRAFSERLAHGGRFRATMLPTAEGLALGVKVH